MSATNSLSHDAGEDDFSFLAVGVKGGSETRSGHCDRPGLLMALLNDRADLEAAWEGQTRMED